MHENISRDLLLMPEVSAMCRLSLATLRSWRFKGIGPRSFKLGARVVYRREDVERWLADQYREGVGA